MNSDTQAGCFWAVVVLFCVAIIGGGCWGYPKYGVYSQELAGQAKLREAESTRKVAVLEAQAKRDSATMLAEAEVERAKGVAKANAIIGESLKNNSDYLRYLWITEMQSDKETIYIPTEAGMPILEATRRQAAAKGEGK